MKTYNRSIVGKVCLQLTIFIALTLSSIAYAQTSKENKQYQERSIDTSRTVTQKSTPTKLTLEQENPAKNNNGYPITYSKKSGEAQIVLDKSYYEKELIRIDQHIKAIDTKIAYVNNIAEEKSKAQASGWFENMEANRSKLIEDRKATMEKIKSFND
jgi:hypothetical protein